MNTQRKAFVVGFVDHCKAGVIKVTGLVNHLVVVYHANCVQMAKVVDKLQYHRYQKHEGEQTRPPSGIDVFSVVKKACPNI